MDTLIYAIGQEAFAWAEAMAFLALNALQGLF